MGELLIRTEKPPAEKDIETDLEWFCRSLGLLGKRDKEMTGLRIFKLFLKAAKKNEPLDPKDISRSVNITRPAVIHHLKIMESAGLITKDDEGFELRMRNLQGIVDEVEKDVIRTLGSIRKIAEDLDAEFGMPVRVSYKRAKQKQ